MNRTWITVVIAALFEVGWVTGLKHADAAWEWAGTAVAIFFSFYFMIHAARFLPVGTVYAVFVGLGTAGTVMVETVLFGAGLDTPKLVFIGLILLGVIGLKLLGGGTKKEGTGNA